MTMKNLIMEITGVFGPTGDEGAIRDYIEEKVRPYADEISTDALGNLIVKKNGASSDKKIMFAAHMDSIGLIVTYIEDNGYIRIAPLGCLGTAGVAHQKVMFKNGVIGVVTYEEKYTKSDGAFEKFYIDIGTSSREETEEYVHLGDSCVYYAPTVELANDMLSSPYVDNRVACAILIKALENQKNYKYDTYFVFSTQEEVGMRGAQTATFGIMPDIGIAVDGTFADEMNGHKNYPVKCGNGPAIKIMDHSVVCSPKVKQMLVDTARNNDIPCQLELITGGGSDTATIQLTGKGVPAGCISYPMRYIHTMVETVSLIDAEYCTLLVQKVTEEGAGL